MTSRKIYGPLDADRREIRLLKLLPGQNNQKPCCELFTVSLSEPPYYEALSYVWGRAESMDAVRVQGAFFKATNNLEAALRDLRYKNKTRILWIDAICINQQDSRERTAQVKLMGQIYQRASGVVVHLPGFIPAFPAFLAQMAAQPELHWQSELEKFEKTTGFSNPLFRQMFELFRSRWWHRVWTMQEAVLATKLDFFLGACSFELSTMEAVINSFTAHYQTEGCCREEGVLENLPLNIWTRMKYLQNILKLSERFVDKTRPLPFSEIILHDRHREATNELDYVFGMLGLLPGSESMVDYTHTASNVFQAAVLYDVQNTKGLDIMSQVIVPDGPPVQDTTIKDLPSWVPNWKQEYYPYYLEDVASRQQLLHLYNACGGEPVSITHHENGLLGLQGVVVDYIVALGEEMRTSNINSTRCLLLLPDNDVVLPAGVKPLDEYPFPTRQEPENYSGAYLATMFADAWSLHQEGRCTFVRGTTARSAPVYLDIEWMKKATSNRRVFRTARGYCGLAPKTAQLRDKVCVLLGGKVPYIIRDAQRHASKQHGGDGMLTYSFVGDAYVHGLMDGQAIAQARTNKLKQECILLGGQALVPRMGSEPAEVRLLPSESMLERSTYPKAERPYCGCVIL